MFYKYDISDILQAADAIEEQQADKAALNGTVSNLIQQIAELSKDLERSKEWEGFWKEQAEEAKGKLAQYALAVANKQRWIPVEERLPEAMQKVLVATYHGGVYFGFMEPRGKFVTANNTLADSWCWEPSVTHWMPLPQAPKEE